MSTELESSRLTDVSTHDDIGDRIQSSFLFDSSLPRQNLAGGSGVFANFFEEMAEPHASDFLTDEIEPNTTVNFENPYATEGYDDNFALYNDPCYPMQAYYENVADNDLDILEQYKRFVDRSRENSTPMEPYAGASSVLEQSNWEADPSTPSLRPGGITGYMRGELDSDMCISYMQRCKPPKILAKRFLLGETIGRGSYGKVKDAIDLVTLRRHAVKVISKLAIRKIPGGWSQALLEASVMLRLPPHRHIVALLSPLRLENPDRLCLVMEHCLGSVHDLQASGVPSTPDEDDEDNFNDIDCAISPRYASKSKNSKDNDSKRRPFGSQVASENHSDSSRQRRGGKNRFRRQLPLISTDVKQETKKFADAFRRRKVSNVEHGRKKSVAAQTQQQQFRRLPESQAHAYFLQLIDGLHFLHRNGVIHRDIKPANLLLTPAPGCGLGDLHSVAEYMDAADSGWLDGNGGQPGFLGRSLSDLLAASKGWLVKLTDFGVSASLSAFQSSDQVSGGQTTPAVQPPEVAKGVQSVFTGSKLDVYSAGVTLYFMLTGRVPFSCQNVLQIFEAIAQGDYTIPGHVSTNAAHLVRKMMCKDPKKRYTLGQISKHAWVINDPTPALTMQNLRAKFQVSSPQVFVDRGIICYLDPLEYLRRNISEFPAPHIDETGARIFTLAELRGHADTPPPGEDAEACSGGLFSQHWVAPISVIDRLKMYNALMDSSKMDSTDVGTPVVNTSLYDGLDSKLSKLGIISGHDASGTPLDYSFPDKSRHYSGGVECIQHRLDQPVPSWHRQRGVTISLPARSPYRQDLIVPKHIVAPEQAMCEPPVCPADLPVSPTMPLHGHQAAMALDHGGRMRAASISGPDEESDGIKQLTESVSICTDLRSGRRAMTYDSEMDAHGVSRDELPPLVRSHASLDQASNTAQRKPSLGRRFSQWISSPFSSLRRRFRHPRHKEVHFDNPNTDRAESNDSTCVHSADHMQTSVLSESTAPSMNSKPRRWLSRKKSRNLSSTPLADRPSVVG